MSDKKRQKTLMSFFPKFSSGNELQNETPRKHTERNVDEILSSPNQLVLSPSISSRMEYLDERPIPFEEPNDIGLYVNDNVRELNTEKRIELLQNAWAPSADEVFPPQGKRNLKFQHKWLHRWKWLAYSRSQNGAFCKVCVLFAPDGAGIGNQKLKKLVKHPFNNYKDAVETFNEHEATLYHKNSVLQSEHLLDVARGKIEPIHFQLDSAAKKRIQENRQKLKPIIETVILCGRQGLSLRGHRDSGPLDISTEAEVNDGNFRSLLRYRARGGDAHLVEHLETCGQNSTYTSPEVQNEIVECCGINIREQLVMKINASQCFSVTADETVDISGVEQLSLCARYFDENECHVREDFLGFFPIQDCTGKNIAAVILDSLKTMGINLDYLQGQGYDGAGAMSGCYNGVQAHISKQYPLAMYVHCSAHSLNLAVSDACSEKSIQNCVGTVTAVYNFLNTPKRQASFREAVDKILPDSNKKRLKQMNPTRWIERHDAFMVFLDLLIPVAETLDSIAQWRERETAVMASHLGCAIRRSEFIVALHVLVRAFSISLPLSKFLQKEDTDLASAMEFTEQVLDVLNEMRSNDVEAFKHVFTAAQKLCGELDVEISIPRIAKRQTQRCNVQTTNPEEYFRIAVFLPFLDHFISEIKERLLKHKTLLQSFMCLIPDGSSCQLSSMQKEQMHHLVQKYQNDVGCNELVALGEFELWYRRVASLDKSPKSAVAALHMCNAEQFPTVRRLLKVLVTLPISTASNERTFSSLRLLKSYLRSRISQDRLSGLAMLYIHRDISVNAEDILNLLSKKKRRLAITL